MQEYPGDTTSRNESCLLRRLKSRLEKDAISAGPKEDYLPKATNPHRPTIKATSQNKN